MAAPFENPQRVQGALTNEGEKDDVLGNDFAPQDHNLDIDLDLPPLKSYESPEITHSAHPEPNALLSLLVEGQEDDGPQLTVMGCRRCFIYVMTQKSKPKCPACKNTKLVDVLEENE